MYLKIFIVAVAMIIFFNARAEEKFSSLKIGSEIYSNVVITSVSTTDIFFTHSRGMGNAKLKDLDPDLQKHFHYDAAKADAIAKKRADDNAQYHKQLISQPQANPPDESRKVVHASDLLWGADLNAALVKAHIENKKVFLDFTGSDWCEWCKKFDAEVLSTDQFAQYAQAKLVLLRLDFPRNLPQSDNLRINNKNIADHFNVTGFPTLLLLNSDGQELGRQVGYVTGGPDAFIALLEKMSNH